MFFKQPQIQNDQLYAEPVDIDPANPASSLDVFKATREEMYVAENSTQRFESINKSYDLHNAKVKELTGVELDNPNIMSAASELDRESRQRFYTDYEAYQSEGGQAGNIDYLRQWTEKEYRKRLEGIAEKHPELRDQLIPDESFYAQALKYSRTAPARSMDAWERSNKGTLDYLAWYGGTVYGAVMDPVNLITLPLAAGAQTTKLGMKGLLVAAGKTAAANAAVEAAIQPFSQSARHEAGLPSGFGVALDNIAGAAVLGGALDVGVRGSFRAIAPQFGFKPVVGADGVVIAWRKPSDIARPEAPAVSAPEIDPDLLKRQAEGDAEATSEILRQIDTHAKKTGEIVIPDAVAERAASGDAALARGLVDQLAEQDPVIRQQVMAADADVRLGIVPDDAITPAEHSRVVMQAARAVADPEHEPFPVRINADPVAPARLPDLERELAELRAKVAKADDPDIEARIAQLESERVTIGSFGRDPLASAEALRLNPSLLTADIDPAMPGPRRAIALSNLSDEAFEKVKRGEASPELGELVANSVSDPLLHGRVLSDLSRMAPVNEIEAKQRMAELLRSPDYNKVPEADVGPIAAATNAPRKIDDPYGAEAKAHVALMEQKLSEELAAAGVVPDPVQSLATPEGRTAAITKARDIDGIIEEMAGIAPQGTTFRVFDGVDDLPPTLRLQVRQANAVRFKDNLDRYMAARSEAERLVARQELEIAKAGEGIEGISDGDTIWIASFAMNPRAKIAHEVVHSLVRTGQLTVDEVGQLAVAARKAGVFSAERETLYRDAYQGRPDVDGAILEEAAAHYMEASIRGDLAPDVVDLPSTSIVDRVREFIGRIREALSGRGYRPPSTATAKDPARDVVDAILTGEVAKREMAPTDASTSRFAFGDDASVGRSMRDDLDNLGYYSQALRAARAWPQAKGTPEQALTWLKKSGVKDAEIDATGLKAAIEGKTSVTRDDVIAHLEQNRVGLNEVGREWTGRREFTPRWNDYSLDPDNPTYRETVLHLPPVGKQVAATSEEASARLADVEAQIELASARGDDVEVARLEAIAEDLDADLGQSVGRKAWGDSDFSSGHFPEPNIIGHMMTSMVRLKRYAPDISQDRRLELWQMGRDGKLDQARKSGAVTGDEYAAFRNVPIEGDVYLIDQIQSDWGQKLRDGGVRDEAKIAAAKKAWEDAQTAVQENLAAARSFLKSQGVDDQVGGSTKAALMTLRNNAEAKRLIDEIDARASTYNRVGAELQTMEAASPGNPLVNTTDQWTNTTLRRAIRQAAEADAEYIAIPSGDTVLSYNPGDTDGMRGFYDDIVPKNLRNILRKLDKQSPDPVPVYQLETPTKGMKGEGFTLFPLTEQVKQKVRDEGQPMFAMRQSHDTAHVTSKDKGAGVYLSAKTGRPGYGYDASGEALLVSTDPARILDWTGTEQSPEVRRALDALAIEHGVAREASGQAFYRSLSQTLGSDEKASAALLEAGVQGHREASDRFDNSVVYDRSLVARDAMAEQAQTPDVDPNAASQISELLTPENIARLAEDIDPEQAMQLAGRLAPELQRYGLDAEQVMPLVQRIMAGEDVSADVSTLARGATDDAAPLFAMRDERGKIKRGAERRAKVLGDDVKQINDDLASNLIGDREALQRKRAVYLNAMAEEAGLDDFAKYKSPRGQEDLAVAFLRLHESYGKDAAPFSDLNNVREQVARQAIGMMEAVVWPMRKGAFMGDLRRVKNAQVRTQMQNMIREAAGEKTSDPMAAQMAKAWLETAEWLRQSFNAAGGDIRKLNGWYAPQYHDAEMLLKAGRDDWVSYMMRDGVLDRDRMLSGDGAPLSDGELRDLLRDAWSTITTDGAVGKDVTDTFGKGALYKRHQDNRVLHFKNADAFMAYANEFGRGDLYAMMIGHIQMMARDIAALRRFGANPELVRERLKQHILLDAKEARSAKSLFDDLSDQVSDLKAQIKSIASPADTAMAKMADIHKRLDKIAGKARHAKEREALRGELFTAHEELSNAIVQNARSPEQVAAAQRIIEILDEIDRVSDTMPVFKETPEHRARRIIARADEMWKLYNGTTNTPLDGRFAGAMSATRNLVSSSVLVAASISSITDIATAVGARSFIGMPAFQQVSSFMRSFAKDERKFAVRAQVGLDQAMRALTTSTRYMGFANTGHLTGYLADRTHAFSGLSAMTQAGKIAFASDFMAWMADLAKTTDFDKLSPWTRQMFDRHGFSEADFNALKTVTPERHRGHPFLTRPAIERDAGEDVAERYMRMLLREQAMAILEPTLQGRTAFISETKPGTILGELSRSVAMVKSFPTTYTMLIMGRFYNQAVQGRLRDGNTIATAASIFILGSMLGALVLQLKALTKGQDPAKMDDKNFWMKAFMQSGGLGIYGDFVANSVNRQGSGLASTIMGPLPQRIGTVLDATVGNVMQYGSDEKSNAGREGVNLLRQMTPGALVPFYFRQVYERMLLDEIQKMVDPEAHKIFRRRQQWQKKAGGNEFYWRPGQFTPDRAPDLRSIISD